MRSTNITEAIIPKTILVCVGKRERGIALQTLLTARGYRVIMALSLYDAQNAVAQELPHLIVTESSFEGGHAGDLHDRLQEHELIAKIPILVWVVKKTRDELAPLVNRTFAAVFVGTNGELMAKIQDILRSQEGLSPFFLGAHAFAISDVNLVHEAAAHGTSQGFLITSLETGINYHPIFTCTPQSNEGVTTKLKQGITLRDKQNSITVFPLDGLVGAERAWTDKLANFPIQNSKKVALYLPDTEKIVGWTTLLSGQGFQASPFQDAPSLVGQLSQNPQRFDCVFLLDDSRTTLAAVQEQVRKANTGAPTIVVATRGAVTIPDAISVPYPISLGQVLHTLEAACRKASHYAPLIKQASHQEISLIYHSSARFLGVDEAGGYLEVRQPLAVESTMHIENQLFAEMFPGQSLKITHCHKAPDDDTWQVRFEASLGVQSKVKRWERIQGLVQHKANQEAG